MENDIFKYEQLSLRDQFSKKSSAHPNDPIMLSTEVDALLSVIKSIAAGNGKTKEHVDSVKTVDLDRLEEAIQEQLKHHGIELEERERGWSE